MKQVLEDLINNPDFDNMSDDDIGAALANEDLTDSDFVDEAVNMSDNDNTDVTITEEDKDQDGDTDKVTIEQKSNEDDLSPEEHSAVKSFAEHIEDLRKLEEANDDDDNSSELDDKPHEDKLTPNEDVSPSEFAKSTAEKRGGKKGEPAPDMNKNKINQIANHLANYRL